MFGEQVIVKHTAATDTLTVNSSIRWFTTLHAFQCKGWTALCMAGSGGGQIRWGAWDLRRGIATTGARAVARNLPNWIGPAFKSSCWYSSGLDPCFSMILRIWDCSPSERNTWLVSGDDVDCDGWDFLALTDFWLEGWTCRSWGGGFRLQFDRHGRGRSDVVLPDAWGWSRWGATGVNDVTDGLVWSLTEQLPSSPWGCSKALGNQRVSAWDIELLARMGQK